MELSGVGLRYGRRGSWVLRDVDLALEPGAVVELTGANGAGKSSLLRVIAGVLTPSAGRVAGRPAAVGWAPERFDVRLPLTVRAYLYAHARMRGLGSRAADEALVREVERWDAAAVLSTRLAELSKGSAQKVGLMQALLIPPALLLLDEPWAGLDAAARENLPAIVAAVVHGGGSVVVTDHQRQVDRLAPTARWHAVGGRVRPEAAPASGRSVVEVQVPTTDAPALVARLRAEGLDASLRPDDPAPT